MTITIRRSLLFTLAVGLASPAAAQAVLDPGVTPTSIRIGNINPYTGPAAAYGASIGRAFEAYFRMVNAQGGIGGRAIDFVSYDDGYSPSRTLEQARRLVESDQVFAVFQSLGTAHNLAIRDYLNKMGVPLLFVGTGGTMFGNPIAYPLTIGWQPSFRAEGLTFARYISQNHPGAKVGILYQNDAFGADMLAALRQGLEGGEIVAALPYEATDPSVDSQIISLKGSGADVFVSAATPKFAAQAIRKAAEIGWKPVQLVSSVSNSVGSVMIPAGVENAVGVMSVAYYKDPTDPTWAADPAMQAWRSFMDRYFPDGDQTSGFSVFAVAVGETLRHVLEACAEDMTRHCVMREAANIQDLEIDLLLPGIRINTSPTDYYPIEQMQIERFNGATWELIGDVIDVATTD